MKVLLDENVPRPLKRMLVQHDVSTVGDIGLQGIRNGDLLNAAELHGFDVFVTCDKNMEYQQKVWARKMGVVLLSTNNWPLMRRYVETIRTFLVSARPGKFICIQCSGKRGWAWERASTGLSSS